MTGALENTEEVGVGLLLGVAEGLPLQLEEKFAVIVVTSQPVKKEQSRRTMP
jgi:hypothetical protein